MVGLFAHIGPFEPGAYLPEFSPYPVGGVALRLLAYSVLSQWLLEGRLSWACTLIKVLDIELYESVG